MLTTREEKDLEAVTLEIASCQIASPVVIASCQVGRTYCYAPCYVLVILACGVIAIAGAFFLSRDASNMLTLHQETKNNEKAAQLGFTLKLTVDSDSDVLVDYMATRDDDGNWPVLSI
tara:strand:- start:237 stop:590 length:354 start_codon:yes stop_codon:yes gene_type:complete